MARFRPPARLAGVIAGCALVTGAVLYGPTEAGAFGAATPSGSTPSSETAVAYWATTGTVNLNVSLRVTGGVGSVSNTIFFLAVENYRDPTTDTTYYLSMFDAGTVPGQIFVVAPKLAAADLVSPTLTVSATEETGPGCPNNGTNLTTVFSHSETINLFTTWLTTGPPTFSSPGNGQRPATAVMSSSVDGLIQLNFLGLPNVASISETTK